MHRDNLANLAALLTIGTLTALAFIGAPVMVVLTAFISIGLIALAATIIIVCVGMKREADETEAFYQRLYASRNGR